MYKVCTRCGQSKPALRRYFYYDNSTEDGYRLWCIECVTNYMRNEYIPTDRRPRLSREYYEKDNAQRKLIEQRLKIEKAARIAPYAGYGIWIDGEKIDIPIKVCQVCLKQYPATTLYFYKKKNKKDGLSNHCRECARKKKKEKKK